MKWVTISGNAQSTVLPHPAYYAKDLTLKYNSSDVTFP